MAFVLGLNGSVNGIGLPVHRLAKEKLCSSWLTELVKRPSSQSWWESWCFSSGKQVVDQNRQVLLFPTPLGYKFRGSSECEVTWLSLRICLAQSQVTVSENPTLFTCPSQERYLSLLHWKCLLISLGL